MFNRRLPQDIDELTQAIEPPSRRRRVTRSIADYFDDKSNRDGRGRKASELRKTRKALRHMRNMTNWSKNELYDLNVRNQIRKFLKHLDHPQDWATTMAECSAARALINESSRRRNETIRYGIDGNILLTNGFVANRLNTVRKLKAAGRRGKNCLGRADFYYINNLKSGTHAYYEIVGPENNPACYLEIKKEGRTITELSGFNNLDCEVPAETLLDFCTKEKVSGDECHEMVKAGALSLTLGPDNRRLDPMSEACHFDIWWRISEVVLRDQKDGSWSRFAWRLDEWDTDDYIWTAADGSNICDENLGFLLRDRDDELAAAFIQATPSSDRKATPRIRSTRRRRTWRLRLGP